MPDITPHLGDYKEGRIQVADGLWADPPELMQTTEVALSSHCDHNFVQPTFKGKQNHYGDGWHRVVLTERCSRCFGNRIQAWKTAVWYEGL